MTAMQKLSIFNLFLMLVSLLVVVGLYYSTGDTLISYSGFAFFALTLYGRRFFHEKNGPATDERDIEIVRRANTIGYAVFWIVFILSTVSYPLVVGYEGTIPVIYVAYAPFAGAWLLVVARSVATIWLYARS